MKLSTEPLLCQFTPDFFNSNAFQTWACECWLEGKTRLLCTRNWREIIAFGSQRFLDWQRQFCSERLCLIGSLLWRRRARKASLDFLFFFLFDRETCFPKKRNWKYAWNFRIKVAFDIHAMNTVTFDWLILCTTLPHLLMILLQNTAIRLITLPFSLSSSHSLSLFSHPLTHTRARARIYNYYRKLIIVY